MKHIHSLRFSKSGTQSQGFLAQYSITAIAIVVATLVRWALNPVLQTEAPFSTYIIAVIFVARKQNFKQTLLASVLGFIAAALFFIPSNHLDLQSPVTWFSRIGMYFVICCAIVFFSEASKRSESNLLEAMALREANADMLRITFESIGDALITTDKLGNVTYLNSLAKELTGYSKGGIGKPISTVCNLINEMTREVVENPVLAALHSGEVEVADHRILVSTDGTEWPIDDRAAPIRNNAGEVVGSVLIIREISGRKRAEASQVERSKLVLLRADFGTALAMTQDSANSLKQVCEAIVRHLDTSFARIWTLNDKDSILELIASAGLYEHLDGSHSRIRVGQYKIGRIAETKLPYLTNSLNDDPEVSDREWVKREGMVAFAGYPLIVDGRVIGVVAMFARHELTEGILQDLSPLADAIAQFIDRKRIEKCLKISEEQVRTALDSAELGTWHVEPLSMTLISDERFRKILGATSESLTYEQAFDLIHPDDRSRVRDAVEASIRAVDPKPYAIEYRVNHPDGSVRWLSAKGRANYFNHRIVSFDGTVADITDRKLVEDLREEFESQFRLLADNIPQLAWIAKPGSDGQLIWFNQNWYDYTGTSLEQMHGIGWHSVVHDDHAGRVIKKFGEHVRSSLDWEDTFPLRRHDGQYRWFLSRMKVIRDQSGNVQRIFGTNTDVTEQMQLAETLRQSAADLSEADQRKNEFLATLAHELRNPLAPIKNAVELMGLNHLDVDSESLRQMMARQVEQLVRLIDDLMDVSRIGRGKITLRRELVDVAVVVDAAVEASSTIIAESGQFLKIQCARDQFYANVDSARLTQVISNLLNNAAKYSGKDCQIELFVSKENDQVLIRVRDNGIGIASDQLEDIFQLFSQVNESVERGPAGLGIGLTLVRTLVELHGGTVTAESDGLGAGSLFTVRLPVANERQVVEGIGKEKPLMPFQQFRILIVEDQRPLRIILARLLEKMGHEVEAVDCGASALQRINDYTPDLVFSDISMPGMTGYELVRQLRLQSSLNETYFVAMTGFGQETDRILAIKSGFDEHMVKPVDMKRLVDLFSRLSTIRRPTKS